MQIFCTSYRIMHIYTIIAQYLMQSTYLVSSYQSRINSWKRVTSYLERIQRLDVHMKQCIPHPWYHEDNIQHEYPLKKKKPHCSWPTKSLKAYRIQFLSNFNEKFRNNREIILLIWGWCHPHKLPKNKIQFKSTVILILGKYQT